MRVPTTHQPLSAATKERRLSIFAFVLEPHAIRGQSDRLQRVDKERCTRFALPPRSRTSRANPTEYITCFGPGKDRCSDGEVDYALRPYRLGVAPVGP